MAIALPYYLDLSGLDLGNITDIWYEPATTSGDFNANSSSNSTSRALNGNSDSWTMIWSHDHLRSSTNSGAVTLVSAQNWSFGIDATNFPYVAAKNEAYTFDEITLGKKNCLALTKSGPAFTLTNFNVPGQLIEGQQTQFFAPSSDLGTNQINFGGGGFIPYLNKYFYGTVDQLVVFNQVLSNSSLSTLFSGFLHQTVTSGSSTSTVLNSINWQGTGDLNTDHITLLSGMANFFVNDVSPQSNGNYYGYIPVSKGGGYFSYSYFDVNPIDVLCPTENTVLYGGPHLLGNPSSGLPNSMQAEVYVNFRDNGSYFSLDFGQSLPGVSIGLDYTTVTTPSYVVSQNTGYYSGFLMQGVVAEEAAVLTLMHTLSGFNYVNNLGVFDIGVGLFKATGAVPNDRVYLDGLPKTGYSLSGEYINISGVVETVNNELIYDQIPSGSFINLGGSTSNFRVANFYPKTAVVATGQSLASGVRRTVQPNFLETYSYHLYHGKKISEKASNPIYQNLDTHFT